MSDPQAPLERALIRGYLHSTMLQNMLFGVYTVIFVGTVHLYISRDKLNRKIVLTAITVLYCLTGINTFISFRPTNVWVTTSQAQADMTEDIIINLSPPWLVVFTDFIFLSGFLVSDLFLIWRCYHVWGMSHRVIALPSFLFLSEFGLLIAALTIQSVNYARPNSARGLAFVFDRIETVLTFISLATTVVTTFLIAYRIQKVADMSSSRSKRRLHHILTIVVESAALYSLALVGFTVPGAIMSLGTAALINTFRPFMALLYMQVFAGIASGLFPTILVARIAIKDMDTEQTVTLTMPHISEVRMDSVAPVPTGMIDGERSLSIEVIPINQAPGTDQSGRSPSRLENGEATVGNEINERAGESDS